jgi:hypothetical protein
MAKPHWTHHTLNAEGETLTTAPGCQNTHCTNPATWQWQRHATQNEENTYLNTQGPYGPRHHSPPPYLAAIYACTQHAPKTTDGHPNGDQMAKTHKQDCPAPDPGCKC